MLLQVVAKGIEILNHRSTIINNNNHTNNNNNDDSKADTKDDVDWAEARQQQQQQPPIQPRFVTDDLVEGIFRTEPGLGTSYELYFRRRTETSRRTETPQRTPQSKLSAEGERRDRGHPPSLSWSEVDSTASSATATGSIQPAAAFASASDSTLQKVVLFRPFAPLQEVPSPASSSSNEKPWINLILPLRGRIDKLRSFMDKFVRICVQEDGRVSLTLVYFGSAGLKQVTNILGGISKKHAFKWVKLVTVSESAFSRGKGLQVGVEAWASSPTQAHPSRDDDVLLFLCDVDVIFNADFLERCRQNTSPGQKVSSSTYRVFHANPDQ